MTEEQRRKLLESFQAKSAEAKTLGEKSSMTAEDVTKLTTLNSDRKNLLAQIKAGDESRALDAEADATNGLLPVRTSGKDAEILGSKKSGEGEIEWDLKEIRGYFTGGSLSEATVKTLKTPEFSRAFRSYLRGGGRLEGMSSDAYKLIESAVDGDGGFLVPEEFLNRLIQKTAAPTRLAGRVTRLSTSSDKLIIPRVTNVADDKYSTGIRVRKTGENPASATVHRADTPTFGQVGLDIHTYMLSLPLTKNQIEDASFPLEAWVASKFSETIELLYDDVIMNGTGQGESLGIVTNAGTTEGIALRDTAGSLVIAGDDLVDLYYDLPEQYLNDNAAWWMNRTNTGRSIAKLKDGQNRYLFAMGGASDGGLQGRRPDALIGYDIPYCAFAPDVAANKVPVIFGDASGYYHVQRIGFSIQVLRELYAETNQVVLLGRVRFGGATAEPFKLKGLRIKP